MTMLQYACFRVVQQDNPNGVYGQHYLLEGYKVSHDICARHNVKEGFLQIVGR